MVTGFIVIIASAHMMSNNQKTAMNREEFELHRDIIDWLMTKGLTFNEAMATLSFAIDTDQTIPQSYFDSFLSGQNKTQILP